MARRRLRFNRILACFHLLLVSLLASCGGDSAQSGSPTATAREILTAASSRLAVTPTIRFTLEVEGDTYIDNARTMQLLAARGELVRPDRVRTDFKIKVLGGVTISTSLIIIGEQHWSTNIITGKWESAPAEFEYNPSILFDNQGGIGPVMGRVNDAQRLADEDLRGRGCYRIQALVDPEVIFGLTAGAMEGSPITVDLWIDRENSNLLRARLSEPATVTGHTPAVWTLDLSGHDSDINIDPPL